MLILAYFLFDIGGRVFKQLHGISPEYAGYYAIVEIVLIGLLVFYVLRLVLIVSFTSYRLTGTRLIIKEGILYQYHNEIELFRIKDYQLVSPLLLRIFGIGHMIVYSSDETNPTKKLLGLRKGAEKMNVLRDLVMSERDRKRVYEVD